MASAPVSQFPAPPAFYAAPALPPAIPDNKSDVKVYGGTVPQMPLSVDQTDSDYGSKLKSQLKGLLTSAVELVGNVPQDDAEIQSRMTEIDESLTRIFDVIESYKHHEAKSTMKSVLSMHVARAREVEAALQRAVDEAEASLAEL